MEPLLFSLFFDELPFHVKNISDDCDIWQMTHHCTHLEKRRRYLTNQLRSGIQLVVTIVMVINPIKTKSMTIASRQKHQLSPVPLDLVPRGAKIDQVSERRLLGIKKEDIY